MLIIPLSSDSLAPSRNMTFTSEQAERILNDLVPIPKRGKYLGGMFWTGMILPENDLLGSSMDYENVNIYKNSSSQPGNLCYVEVRFKK